MDCLPEGRAPPSRPYEKRAMYMKRDIKKKTYVYEKRPRKETSCDSFMNYLSVVRHSQDRMKRDLCIWKETFKKRLMYMKRDIQKKTYVYEKRLRVTHSYGLPVGRAPQPVWNETFIYEKRTMLWNERYKRDLCIWKETSKRDLGLRRTHSCATWKSCATPSPHEKRPMYMKRDIQKRPVNMKRDLEKRSTHSCATWVSCATPSLRSRAARQFVTLTVRIQFLKSQLDTYHMDESSLFWVSFHTHRSLLYVSFHAYRSRFIYRHTISQKSAWYVSHGWVFSVLGLFLCT